MNNYLITGGTGFLGRNLVNRLYGRGNIRVVARDEGKLLELQQQYPDIEIMTGDIADECFVRRAVKDMDSCFHLAAFKHVGLAEKQPSECISTNVDGTRGVLRHFTGNYFIHTSTDKAAQVSGVYGASKLLAERLVKDYDYYLGGFAKYRQVRYGNVLYSTGSVLCKWKELIQAGKPVTITDPNATRFFWTVDQAVDLLFECGEKAVDATPYVPTMKAMRVHDLYEAMRVKYSNGGINVRIIGLQPGENMHERLTADGPTSEEAEKYTIEEIMQLI